jgi:hypothetical protein
MFVASVSNVINYGVVEEKSFWAYIVYKKMVNPDFCGVDP